VATRRGFFSLCGSIPFANIALHLWHIPTNKN
jgi:hypothetical protein